MNEPEFEPLAQATNAPVPLRRARRAAQGAPAEAVAAAREVSVVLTDQGRRHPWDGVIWRAMIAFSPLVYFLPRTGKSFD